jgi:hypothetical protein
MKTLSIALDDALFEKLKRHIPSGKISKFISGAISEKIEEKEAALYNEYLAASKEQDINEELKDWDGIDGNNW